ncbi:MAG: hypothetical protein COS89_04210 [Deltaproteobacteria bacterium CG07_land_8_20_14_0_80_38_7]|nr:MAG: hypothetical protein COS89_04210 [Deltaproteobacteria bacterium CG07_land_8_20_14_0_80_38_7]
MLTVFIFIYSCSKGTEVQNPPSTGEVPTIVDAVYSNGKYGFKVILTEEWVITSFGETSPVPSTVYKDPFNIAETVALF